MSEPWAAKCWRDYELPDGRTPDSFAYKVEEIWDGYATDVLYTDDPSEAERIIRTMRTQAYDVRVAHDGETIEYKAL